MLIIFIDGLRYDDAATRLKILGKARLSRMVPAAGFSNNIYPEMFCGLNPDEIGFFNEWSPADRIRAIGRFSPFRLLDLLRKFKYINAGLRVLLLRKGLGIKTANIPFRYWGYFQPAGPHHVRSLGPTSVLTRHNFTIVDSAEYPLRRRRRNHRDIQALAKVRTLDMRDRNIFLSLTETDTIAHSDGLGSVAYDEHLRYLDEQLDRVIRDYRKANPGNPVYALSDHGMVAVTRYVHVDLEGTFGEMHPAEYLFFLDSTYLRVWIRCRDLRDDIQRYLLSLGAGAVLSSAERLELGISRKEYGDIIFRADEGVMFVPSFFGFRRVKAMHGYDSHLRSQTAFFAQVHSSGPERPLPRRSKDVYGFLTAVLSESG